MEFIERECGRRWRAVGMVLLILVAGGCGGGAATPTGPAEIPGPVSVDGLSPSDGATDFSRSSSLEIPFTEPMNRESVEAAFSLSAESEGAALVKSQSVTGTFTWNSDDTAMTFDPAEALAPLTRYCMRIAAGALTADGDEIAAFESCFTTSGEVVALDGTWVRSCYDLNSDEGRIDTFVVSGTSSVMTEVFYEAGADCAVLQHSSVFSFTASSQGPSTDVAGAEKVVGTVVSETVTPLSESVAVYWNNATPSGFCGYTDWTSGVAKDISGNGTASSLGDCWNGGEVVGSTFNFLTYVDESADPDTLQLSDDICVSGLCAGSEFPTSLESSTFVKQ